jgi:hypothetical protein
MTFHKVFMLQIFKLGFNVKKALKVSWKDLKHFFQNHQGSI